jgi:hypothetical protein
VGLTLLFGETHAVQIGLLPGAMEQDAVGIALRAPTVPHTPAPRPQRMLELWNRVHSLPSCSGVEVGNPPPGLGVVHRLVELQLLRFDRHVTLACEEVHANGK